MRSDPTSVPMARVAVIAVNWNGWHDTLECIESVSHLEYRNYVLVVVDTGSTDDSLERITGWARQRKGYLLVDYTEATARAGGDPVQEQLFASASPHARAVLIRGAVDSGPTGGGNLAIAYALRRSPPPDYVFFLDNDATVERDTLTHLVDLDRREDAGIVGGVVISSTTGEVQYAERTTLLRWFFAPVVALNLPCPEDAEFWESGGASGGALLVRRETLEAVFAAAGRHLSEEAFLDGWEIDLCTRARLAGYRCLVSRKGFVRHKGERVARMALNPRRYYYTARSPFLFAPHFLSLHWRALYYLWAIFLNTGRLARALLHRRPDVARAILRGVLDGVQGVGGRWQQ